MAAALTLAIACEPSGRGGGSGADAGGEGQDGAGGSGGNGGAAGGPGGSDGSAAGPRDGGRPDNDCLENFDLQRGPPPNVVIVLDRSGSMKQVPTTGMGTLWEQTSAALKTAVMATEADIKWGIGFFPADGDCAVSPVEVPVSANNFPAVAVAIDSKVPGGNTPTKKAVDEAARYLDSFVDPSRKYILLATDGGPNCGTPKPPMCPAGYMMTPGGCCPADPSMGCMGLPGGSSTEDSLGAEEAVAAAAAKGYHSFVVGLAATATFSDVLDRLAVAGKEPRTGTTEKYYKVDDQAGLEAAMKSIATQIVSCEFPLSKVPANPDSTTVFMNGMMVPRDPARLDGWEFGPGLMSIVLYGSYCDTVKGGAGKDVTAFFGCRTI